MAGGAWGPRRSGCRVAASFLTEARASRTGCRPTSSTGPRRAARVFWSRSEGGAGARGADPGSRGGRRKTIVRPYGAPSRRHAERARGTIRADENGGCDEQKAVRLVRTAVLVHVLRARPRAPCRLLALGVPTCCRASGPDRRKPRPGARAHLTSGAPSCLIGLRRHTGVGGQRGPPPLVILERDCSGAAARPWSRCSRRGACRPACKRLSRDVPRL
jgi:hypothetical protein